MFKALFSMLMVMLISTGSTGCEKKEEKMIILGQNGTACEKPIKEAKVRIAVGWMITPKEGVVYYIDLFHYVQDKIGKEIEYVDRESYAEINEMLRTGKLDAAFVCSGPYTDGKKKFGLELLVAPQAYGALVYYSYILVAKGSRFSSFEELRGKRFAFTDPLSNTGKLAPTYMLAKMNETPEKFFEDENRQICRG